MTFTLDGIEDDPPKLTEDEILEAMARMLNGAIDREIMETLRGIRESMIDTAENPDSINRFALMLRPNA